MSLRDRMNAEVMNEAKDTREYRADRLVERWSRMPGIGKGINKMSEKKARNLAILLENESKYLSRFNEAQFASNFDNNKPENLLKLVRIVYPNSVREDLFYCFSMETANDSIKYVEPVYEGSGKRTPVYEQVGDQTGKEAGIACTETMTAGAFGGDAIVFDKDGVVKGACIDGALVPYDLDTRTTDYYVKKGADIHPKTEANGLHDCNFDMGEIELQVRSYRFEPKALTLGVSWTMLSEIILDGSFGVSSEELLMDSASQELKKALDYQSIAFAWACKTVGATTFNAMNEGASSLTTMAYNGETYYQRAQVVGTAINKAKNAIYNDQLRGGISAIVGDADSIEYLKLSKAYEAKGLQTECGAYKAGEFNGIPLFVAPKALLSNGNNLMTTWTNESAGADASIAIGTYMPLYSTGAMARKSIYKEMGMARFEDTVLMNASYLRQISLQNLL